jgi:large subunit ribosomal protein L22
MTRATLRYHQASPSKVRQVLELVRGLDVSEARELLRFSQRAASVEVGKLLDSAVANAEHNDHVASDELYVAAAWADEGPTMKRFRPRARGRGTRIRKRTSHITIEVARYSDEELSARSDREAAAGVGAAAERRRRLSRGRRVAASTAAQAHDHDHDHDEVEVGEPLTVTDEPVETGDEADAVETAVGAGTAEPATGESTAAEEPADDEGAGDEDGDEPVEAN